MREQYRLIRGALDERGRREWAASEAMALGYAGIALVHRASGIVPSTIGKGIKELRERQDGETEPEERRRVRRPGGGRASKTSEDPQLLGALESLVEPCTRGDPESALRWTCKSLRALAEELARLGHAVSYRTVGRVLKGLDYGLQANRKTLEGTQHADRNAQFEYINRQSKKRIKANNPAISVDTKKKELVGEYKNGVASIGRRGGPSRSMYTTSKASWVG